MQGKAIGMPVFFCGTRVVCIGVWQCRGSVSGKQACSTLNLPGTVAEEGREQIVTLCFCLEEERRALMFPTFRLQPDSLPISITDVRSGKTSRFSSKT